MAQYIRDHPLTKGLIDFYFCDTLSPLSGRCLLGWWVVIGRHGSRVLSVWEVIVPIAQTTAAVLAWLRKVYSYGEMCERRLGWHVFVA